LTDSGNAFNTTNTAVTSAMLGNPTHTTAEIINFVRGADVFDADKDGNIAENRLVITGDVLHSEPMVFHYSDSTAYVFFGSNDGMLHAINDSTGSEAWAFIPPDILPKLRYMIEGAGHQIYVDSSPKIYFSDSNNNGIVDSGEKVILICGERKGGYSYFALDITDPASPKYLWRIDNITSTTVPPEYVLPNLGQSWSEPQFGLVKTSSTDTVGTPIFFIGGGYSSNNATGKSVLAIKVMTGEVLKTFTDSAMNYSIPSNILVIDENDNGFVDKLYVGDLGSQMWRIGNFTNLIFPNSDENINNWSPHIVFISDSTHARKFYYAPSLTLEFGYDLLFFGTGDRENACTTQTYTDRFYSVKDKHDSTTLIEGNLVDVSSSTSLTNTSFDLATVNGWYMQLATGEKVLAENTIFYKVAYFTTFTPTVDPCTPGGDARAYAVQYKSGSSIVDMNKDGTIDKSLVIGGGIPSKPVMVVTDTTNPAAMLVSVGSTSPDDTSQSFNAGVINLTPLSPDVNFMYRWWRELTDL